MTNSSKYKKGRSTQIEYLFKYADIEIDEETLFLSTDRIRCKWKILGFDHLFIDDRYNIWTKPNRTSDGRKRFKVRAKRHKTLKSHFGRVQTSLNNKRQHPLLTTLIKNAYIYEQIITFDKLPTIMLNEMSEYYHQRPIEWILNKKI